MWPCPSWHLSRASLHAGSPPPTPSGVHSWATAAVRTASSFWVATALFLASLLGLTAPLLKFVLLRVAPVSDLPLWAVTFSSRASASAPGSVLPADVTGVLRKDGKPRWALLELGCHPGTGPLGVTFCLWLFNPLYIHPVVILSSLCSYYKTGMWDSDKNLRTSKYNLSAALPVTTTTMTPLKLQKTSVFVGRKLAGDG